MPDRYVGPELALYHNGVAVYHAYLNGNIEEPLVCYYTTDAHENAAEFDIRDLAAFDLQKDAKEVLRTAIDSGEIKPETVGIHETFYMNRRIRFPELLSKDELINYLARNGPNDRSLNDVRTRYENILDFDPIWRYPITDDLHAGAFIVPIQEGFLWIPYDDVSLEDYEQFVLADAKLMDEAIAREFRADLYRYAWNLCNVLDDIATILSAHPDMAAEQGKERNSDRTEK